MALIKQSKGDRLLKDAIVLDLGDIQRQAEQILERARQEADDIVARGEAEAKRLIDSASAIGFEKGLEKGLEEGRVQGREEGKGEILESFKPQLEQLLSTWTSALETWESQRQDMLLAAREDVLTFAFALAQKLTFRIIESDPTVIEDQLAESLALLSRPTAATIIIHPDDRAMVEEVLPRLVAACTSCVHVSIREEESFSRGGCIVRTDGGEIDATIETQLDRLVEALLPWAAHHSEGRADDSKADSGETTS